MLKLEAPGSEVLNPRNDRISIHRRNPMIRNQRILNQVLMH